jgi:hypothetical protein
MRRCAPLIDVWPLIARRSLGRVYIIVAGVVQFVCTL